MSTTRRRRPALIALAVIAAVACLVLGWWQWNRFESASGTGQNLGYALQWPLFAGFVVFAYRRFVVLEEQSESDEPVEHEPTEIPADLLPPRPIMLPEDDDADDPVRREYNAYLAQLAHNDHRSNPA